MIYIELFLTFFKIGLFTFGGGYAMLPLIQEEVLAHEWMELSSLVNFIAVSESTPGPFAVNMATYVGSQMGGILGAACATLGVVLPSFIIILIVAKIYEAFKKNEAVKGVMTGLKPAVVGLIGSAILSIAASVLFSNGLNLNLFSNIGFYVTILIFISSTIMAFKKVHPILIICFSALIGIISGYLL